MIARLVLSIMLLLLFCSCAASESRNVETAGSSSGEAGALEEARAAGVPSAPTQVKAADTREPPPMPSPVPTVTASLSVGTESTSIPTTDKRIRYNGRFDFQNPQGPAFDWSGSAIEIAFSGTGLTLYLADGRNSYNVSVDGRSQVLETESGQEAYLIAEGLEPGDYLFRLSKRTEAYVGAAVFKGLHIAGGSLKDPPPGPGRRIEFIGDSITTGYGNEGQSPDCWFTPATQNADRSYAAITAEALDADYSLIALSGLGVVRNLRADEATSDETAIDFIDRTLGLNPFIVWPPDKAAPDVVVINLGTNDYSSVPFPSDEEFVAAYMELLLAVRTRYPQAAIFSVAGPLMLEPAPRMIESAVTQFRTAQIDDLVRYVLIEDNLERSAADFGCDWHPNVSGHEKIAVQLAPAIAEQLGW